MAAEIRTSTLFISNLPQNVTSEELESVFLDDGPIKRCFVVNEKGTSKGRGFGYVTFSLHDDAVKAISDKKVYKGRNLEIKYASRRIKPGEPQIEPKETTKQEFLDKRQRRKDAKHKRHRLIVRNLAFKASMENIKEHFSTLGTVLDIHIPTGSDGKRKGFCFVQYENVSSAAKAIKKFNGQELQGRKVAIDWTVPKQQFLNQHQQVPASQKKKQKNTKLDDDSDSDSDKSISEDNRVLENDKSLERSSDSDSAIMSDNANTSDQEGNESSGDEYDQMDNSNIKSDESDQDMEIDDDEEKDSSIESDDNQKLQDKKKKLRKRDKPSDVQEGCTLFIRNIPFESTEEELEDCFSQWGEISYVMMVTDKATLRPKGTAFVKFANVESAKSCIEDCETKPIIIDGRTLEVLSAVKSSEASQLNKKEKHEVKDSRNLWLVRVGAIRQGTEEAKGLSAADLIKRSKIEAVKRQKLKNPNIFVSPTRLSVHNVPATVDNKKLKTMFLKAVADKSAQITECRIMCDMNRVNSKGVPKSRGFAFINFTNHQHALKALENTNNNPELFGDKKRLIVEFSLENRLALAAKEKRMERIKVKHAMLKGDGKRTTYNKIQKKKSKQKDVQSDMAKPPQKGMKALPTHTGPKIRHKARPKQTATSQKQVKKSNQLPKEKKKKVKRQTKKAVSSDAFDSLVAKYKKKFTPSLHSSKDQKKNKWFQ